MPVRNNTVTASDNVVRALNEEFIDNFRGEYDRFAETIGLFNVSTVAAGTQVMQRKVSGTIENSAGTDGSSGTAYVDGDFVKRSKITYEEVPVGQVKLFPYAKQTTGNAILSATYANSVLRTDMKLVSQVRAAIVSDFFALLANGTSTANGGDLQAALAYTSAKMGDVLEAADEDGGAIVYFVNRQDAAAYLAKANVSTQSTFGMTYLQDFLGVQNVLLTNKVAAGTLYATPVDNIHVFGADFGELARADLNYDVDSLGLVGVTHRPSYNYVSTETHVARAAQFVPEVTDFIVKGTIGEVVDPDDGE